jgi:hypothetical protein
MCAHTATGEGEGTREILHQTPPAKLIIFMLSVSGPAYGKSQPLRQGNRMPGIKVWVRGTVSIALCQPDFVDFNFKLVQRYAWDTTRMGLDGNLQPPSV